MIITGYQGIGKSTLAKTNDKIIDLESSCFWKYDLYDFEKKGEKQDLMIGMYIIVRWHSIYQSKDILYLFLVIRRSESFFQSITKNDFVRFFQADQLNQIG